MKVKRIVNLITAVLLVAVMFLGISRTAEPVYADAGDPAMQMGASALSKGANTAGAQVLKYGGRTGM